MAEDPLDEYTMAALIQEAIDCIPNALTIFDENFAPILANKVSHELYGVLHAAMSAGKSYREATFLSIQAADPKLCEDECWQLADMLEALFRSGDTVEVSHSGGRIFRTSYRPMSGDNHVAVAAEITELRQREEELIQSQQQAEAANEAKSSFLADLSHEIRTPLNGILGMAQVLVQGDLTPEQREQADIVLELGNSLKTLLDDVLDLSKIEAGTMELLPVDKDLHQVLRRQLLLWLPRAAEKGIALTLTIDPSVPALMRFDPIRLGQCISNIVSNAIKFTETGEVAIRANGAAAAQGTRVTLTVRDTGIGMSRATAKRLFAPFAQADSSIFQRFGGTGLGLVITQKLTRLMEGDLTVESEEGAGSTFTLAFTAQPAFGAADTAAKAGEAPPARKPIRGMKVLLVDDHPLNRRVLRLFLDPEGCRLTDAENGREALERLAAERFDLVLLDIHMPVLDGIETLKRIRASSEPWRDVPIIAVTADAMSGDRDRYLAEGVDGYLAKPIDKLDLLGEIQKLLGLDASAGGQNPAPATEGALPLAENDLARHLAETDAARSHKPGSGHAPTPARRVTARSPS